MKTKRTETKAKSPTATRTGKSPAKATNSTGAARVAKPRPILYAGDNSLTGAAAYLGGIMAHCGLKFDHVGSDTPIAGQLAAAKRSLYIISDYPVKNFTGDDFDRLADAVRGGAGLLMIGGWESFHGQLGEYHRSPLAEVLPIVMTRADDRVNSAQPLLVEKVRHHPIVDDLPFDRPPGVGGYNRVQAKTDAATILVARHFAVEAEVTCEPAPCCEGGRESDLQRAAIRNSGGGISRRGATPDEADEPEVIRGSMKTSYYDDSPAAACRPAASPAYRFEMGEASPLLVVGSWGQGRTAAFMSDVAPHWVGGLVDWGEKRVTAQAPAGNEIEVGHHYAQFFANLLRWTMNEEL